MQIIKSMPAKYRTVLHFTVAVIVTSLHRNEMRFNVCGFSNKRRNALYCIS